MDIASVFAWFAQESMRAADLAHEPRQREIWTRLAVMWGLAELTADTGKSARICRCISGDGPKAAPGEKARRATRRVKRTGSRARRGSETLTPLTEVA